MFGYLRAVRDMSNLIHTIQADNNALREELARERTARYYAQVRMAELKLEQVGSLAELKRLLAIAQSNFEWLSAMHNQASAERSQLMAERTGVRVPAPTVAINRDELSRGVPLTDIDPDTPLEDLVGRDDLFNDVGDRAASVMGLDKPRTYDDPSALLES